MRRNQFKRKGNFSVPPKYILLIMTLLLFIVMFVSFTLNITGGPLQTVAGYVFVPMQKGINSVGNVIYDVKENFRSLKEVQAENEELKSQVESLNEQLNTIKLEQYDLSTYRELLDLDEKYPEYTKVYANVIGKDTGNWFSTFLIDKGTDDGVEVDMNVIAEGGLVGIVISVGPNYAKVRSIIDDVSQVSAMVLNTSDLCLVNGDLILMNENQTLELKSLRDSGEAAQIGDAIVTSNVSSKYLPGILIGHITTLEEDSNNLTKSGTVSPIVDFEHLQAVSVILEKKDTSGLTE